MKPRLLRLEEEIKTDDRQAHGIVYVATNNANVSRIHRILDTTLSVHVSWRHNTSCCIASFLLQSKHVTIVDTFLIEIRSTVAKLHALEKAIGGKVIEECRDGKKVLLLLLFFSSSNLV